MESHVFRNFGGKKILEVRDLETGRFNVKK